MDCRTFMTLVLSPAAGALMGLTLIAFPLASTAAPLPPPPRDGCVTVSTGEYDTPNRKKAYNRFGTYVRTRVKFRRYYWYCPL